MVKPQIYSMYIQQEIYVKIYLKNVIYVNISNVIYITQYCTEFEVNNVVQEVCRQLKTWLHYILPNFLPTVVLKVTPAKFTYRTYLTDK